MKSFTPHTRVFFSDGGYCTLPLDTYAAIAGQLEKQATFQDDAIWHGHDCSGSRVSFRISAVDMVSEVTMESLSFDLENEAAVNAEKSRLESF